MAIQTPVLRVLPNPWCAIDGQCRPAGACAVDPSLPEFGGRRFIGADFDRDKIKILDKPPKGHGNEYWLDFFITPRQRTVYKFDTEPAVIRNNGQAAAVIKRKIRHGELFAADRATAKEAGVKFVEPDVALKAAYEAARAKFDADHIQPGAFDYVTAMRLEEEATEACDELREQIRIAAKEKQTTSELEAALKEAEADAKSATKNREKAEAVVFSEPKPPKPDDSGDEGKGPESKKAASKSG